MRTGRRAKMATSNFEKMTGINPDSLKVLSRGPAPRDEVPASGPESPTQKRMRRRLK